MKKIFLAIVLAFFFKMQVSACTCTCNCTVSTASRILDACAEVAGTLLSRNTHYSDGDDLVWGDIAKCYSECEGMCSPTFITLVLYVSGVFTEKEVNAYNYNWAGEGGILSLLEDYGWIKVPLEKVAPGNILVNPGSNALVYAGNGICWGVDSCLSTGSPEKRDITGYIAYSPAH